MKYSKYTLFFTCIAFFCACNSSKKKTNIEKLQAKDSLEIVHFFTKTINEAQLSDSLIAIKGSQYKNEATKHFFKFNYFQHLIKKGNLDEAQKRLMEELNIPKLDTTSMVAAKYYNLLGNVYAYSAQQEKAVTYYKHTMRILELSGNHKGLALIQFNIANIFLSRLDYASAYDYAKKSSTNFEKVKDTTYSPISYAISAVGAIHLNKKYEAEQLSKKALGLSEKHNNIMGLALSNYAIGEISLDDKLYEKAKISFEKAATFSVQARLLPTEVACLTSLTKTYLELKDYNQVVVIGKKGLEKAILLNNGDILYSLHKNMATAYENLQDSPNAYAHLKEADIHLRKKFTDGNPKALQELLVAYETEKKEKQIIEQTLKIQEKQSNLFYALLGGGLLISLFGGIFIYNRKAQKLKLQKLQQEKENAILGAFIQGEERERNRISHELHDGVAATIGAVKMGLETVPHLSKEKQEDQLQKLTTILENTHADVRHMAHNLLPVTLEKEGLIEATKQFASEINQAQLLVITVTDDNSEADKKMTKQLQLMLFRIIQELVNNIIKHSQAEKATIHFNRVDDWLEVIVTDNGIGYQENSKNGSQGLFSISQRLKSIGGNFNISTTKNNSGTQAVAQLKLQ